MSSNNNWSGVGNLTADPQLRQAASGKVRATFSLAINKPDYNGAKQDPTFVDVTILQEDLARNVCESLHKGSQAVVIGELNSYTTELTLEGGETRKIGRISVNGWEVGTGLRFATAKPVKVVREGNGHEAASAPASAPASAGGADPNDF